MKKATLTLAFSMFSVFAFAGPEPISSKEIVPPAPAPAPCFSGWYMGFHGAVTWEEGDIDTFAEGEVSETDEGTTFFSDHFARTGDDSRGGFGGFHLGRNFQFGAFMVGLEADISVGSMDKLGDRAAVNIEETDDFDASARVATESDTQLNWYSTLRPRIGYVFMNDRVMAFVTGGLAVGQADAAVHTNVLFDIEGSTGERRLKSFDDDVRTGWTVGGGLEYCLGHNWTLNFTYLYMDLGDKDLRTREFGPVFPGFEDSLEFARGAATSDLHFHIFQAGLSYMFF